MATNLDNIVNLTITIGSSTITRAGFGTALMMAYHNVVPDRVIQYSDTEEMVTDGWPLTHPVYRCAQKHFSQNPRPNKIVIGKRLLPYTQTLDLTPKNLTTGYVYAFTLTSAAGVDSDISYTVTSGQDAAGISTGIVAAIGSVTDLTATEVGATTLGHVHLVSAAGKLINLKGLPTHGNMTVKDVTADPGVVTDLTGIEAIDSGSWYDVLLDSNSKAEVVALAAAIETRRKQFRYNTTDSEVLDGTVSNDVMSTLQDNSYMRTGGIYSGVELLSYSAAAWEGFNLPSDPGKSTYAYSPLVAVTADNLSTNDIAQLTARNGNWFINLGGSNVTMMGKCASGEWIDTVRFLDWMYSRTQERVFAAFVVAAKNGTKIGFNNKGVSLIKGLILAQIADGIKAEGINDTPAPTVVAPKVADVSDDDKQNRILPDISGTFTLNGAILAIKAKITVSV